MGAVSLPLPPAQRLGGFWSLFQGLLDHNGTATPQGKAGVPAKLPGAIATKKTGERTANPADTSLPPPFVDPVTAVGSIMSVAASATPVIHVGEIPRGGSSGQGPSTPLGAVPGLSAITQTLPVVLRSLAETSSPSGSSSPDRNPPGAGGNIAFALQLSWQASGPKRESNIPDATQSDAIQPREPDAKNPSDVAGQTAQSAGCNEGALRLGSAGGEKQTGLSVPDPALLEARSSQGSFQLPSSSPSLVPSIPAPLPAAVAIAPQGAELPTPETGPAPLTRGLAAEGSANPDEIDAPSEGWIEGAASSVERPSVSPPGREFREIFTPKTETQTEASTLPSLGQQQGPGQQESHESAKAPRSPVTPSANITASQGTAPNEPGTCRIGTCQPRHRIGRRSEFRSLTRLCRSKRIISLPARVPLESGWINQGNRAARARPRPRYRLPTRSTPCQLRQNRKPPAPFRYNRSVRFHSGLPRTQRMWMSK